MRTKQILDLHDAINYLENADINISTVIENLSLIQALKAAQEQIASAIQIIQDLIGI